MKLHLSLLEKLVELPTKDPLELRPILDDLGLEVKGVEGEGLSTIFTVESLANRGDHLYALGAAREFSARYLVPLRHPALAGELTDRKTSVPVRNATDKCLRYALLEMSVPKPMDLRSDIAAIMQSEPGDKKHAIVDILNYIQLELGQPMHAFDREKVEGEVAIDLTDAPADIEALDGKTYRVPPKSIVIRDKKKIIAVAGVIGCKNSMVTPDTTAVLVESATFDPVSVRITARAMGLSTDASYAFERGCDRESPMVGLKRLVALVQGAGGAEKNSCHVLGLTVAPSEPLEKRRILLQLSLIREQLNLPRLPDVEISTRLKNLGFALEPVMSEKNVLQGWQVTVPSWRLWDVKTEQDLTEEVARACSYSKVKLDLPPLDYDIPEPAPTDVLLERIEPALVGAGFIEVISKIFYTADDVEALERLAPGSKEKHLTIKNAVERSYSHVKITNILHLAKLSAESHRHGVLSFKVYEFGRVFSLGLSGGPFEFERDVLTVAASGRWSEHEWQKPESTEELLYLFKGVIENTVRTIATSGVTVVAGENPFLHPGCQAGLKIGRDTIGSFGLLHPMLKERLDLRHDLVFAELDAAKLIKVMGARERRAVSDFPAIRRDATLRVPLTTMAGKVTRAIVDTKPANLADVAIVDNFRKDGEEFRRVTFRLTFQSNERTLESAEADTAMDGVLSALRESLGIERA